MIISSDKQKAILGMWERENGSYQSRDSPEMTNENPVSVVGSALTLCDDDKLIHKSNLVSNNVFGQSNRSIFIFSWLSACLSRTLYFHPHVEAIRLKRKNDNDFYLWKKAVMSWIKMWTYNQNVKVGVVKQLCVELRSHCVDFNSRLFTKTLHWFKMITFMCAADCLIPK